MTGATQSGRQAGASPRRTFALVVAADCYEMADSGWALPQALDAARMFVGWLGRNGVPEENIHLLTGGLECPDLDGVFSPSRWKRATFENLDRTLKDDLARADGDLLLVFWSGHGEMRRRDKRLYLPEMSDTRCPNVSAEGLLECLGTSPFRFYEQAVFFDACAGFESVNMGDPTPFNPSGHEVDRRLYSISTREGVKSVAGTFGPVLVEELSREAWPPPFADVILRVQERIPYLEVAVPGKKIASGGRRRPPGPGLYRHCDRVEAARRFHLERERVLARERPGPLVTVVYGSHKQKPNSLVLRFLDELVDRCGYSREPSSPVWNGGDTAEVKRALEAESHLPVVVFRQVVIWSDTVAEELAKYLQFWASLRLDPAGPRVFVFLESMSPQAMECAWWRQIAAHFGRNAPEDRMRQALRRAGCEHLCHVIGPENLLPVKRDDLHAFHVEHALEENYGLTLHLLMEKLFGEGEQASMLDVEKELIKAFQGAEYAR